MSGAPMEGEGFLRRWSRLKSTGGEAAAPQEAPAAAPAGAASPADPLAPAPAAPVAPAPQPAAPPDDGPAHPAPTLEDVAQLTADSDYSAFVARGVDKNIQRLALRKLFTDPHFNIKDGLDIYMDDFTKPSPLSPAMLASLQHAQDVVARLLGDKEEEEKDGDTAQAAQETLPPPPQQGNA